MERKPYSAGAVKFSFWFMEFRKTVQLLSEGKSFADIKKLNEETNIYGAPTKLRAQQIYSTVTARIKTFTQKEWMDVMLRSCGYEPEQLNNREKWLLLARMLPLVENNFNLCELGPRSTGKSHIYKEISPNSILVSGGQTTVANLFYNMGRKTVGLVGLWDCVAFDEVAGIKFKDKDGIQIMKDYMASGSFARGKEEKAASASIINYQDLQGIGMTGKLALPTLIALCSIALGRPTVSTLAVLGEISISGTILKVDELANSLQVCLDSGAKKVLLPITSAADLGTVPPELVGSFNLIFYSSAEDAVFKALGVE